MVGGCSREKAPSSPHKETPALQAPLDPTGSQSGESEMGDKANESRMDVLPQSNGKWGTKVSEADQVKHPLTGGRGSAPFARGMRSVSRYMWWWIIGEGVVLTCHAGPIGGPLHEV